jgi:hypothetical protein
MACAREGIVRGLDVGACQVRVDLTRSVTFFTLWSLTGLDRTPRIGESGHFVLESPMFHFVLESSLNDRTRSSFDRTRPVSVQCLHIFLFDDRTRSASGHRRSDKSGRSGSLLDSNRTLALSRPVISPARPVIVLLCAAQADQRVRSFTGPARPVVSGASGRRDERVRSLFRS